MQVSKHYPNKAGKENKPEKTAYREPTTCLLKNGRLQARRHLSYCSKHPQKRTRQHPNFRAASTWLPISWGRFPNQTAQSLNIIILCTCSVQRTQTPCVFFMLVSKHIPLLPTLFQTHRLSSSLASPRPPPSLPASVQQRSHLAMKQA